MPSNTLRDAHKPHKTRFGAVSLGFSVTFAALHSQKTPRIGWCMNQCQLVKRTIAGCCLSWGGRRRQLLYPTEPRFRSEKSAADAKLEKTSLSAGGFLRVPYGFGIGLWLHTRQAIIKISNNMAHHGYSIRIIFCFFPT